MCSCVLQARQVGVAQALKRGGIESKTLAFQSCQCMPVHSTLERLLRTEHCICGVRVGAFASAQRCFPVECFVLSIYLDLPALHAAVAVIHVQDEERMVGLETVTTIMVLPQRLCVSKWCIELSTGESILSYVFICKHGASTLFAVHVCVV